MNIAIRQPMLDILNAQVAAGRFATIEEAMEAAVFGLVGVDTDLSWAKAALDEADKAIDADDIVDEDRAFAELERRYGRI